MRRIVLGACRCALVLLMCTVAGCRDDDEASAPRGEAVASQTEPTASSESSEPAPPTQSGDRAAATGGARPKVGSPAGASAATDSSGSLPLPELVPERALSPATVLPRSPGLLAISPEGAVQCVPNPRAAAVGKGRELPPHVDVHACRDARLALSPADGITHYFQDGRHSISDNGRLPSSGNVSLEVSGTPVLTWSLQADRVPLRCGLDGFARLTRTLTLDIACRGDVAAVRWVLWRAFLNQPCDPKERGTRSPDLDCRTEAADSPHAVIHDAGISKIDLRTGAIESLR